MPNTDSHGFIAPLGSDVFAPDADMRAGRVPHHSRSIIPVPNATAQDELVSAHGPTSSKPLFVYRADLDLVQYTRNGTDWRPVSHTLGSWRTPTAGSGVDITPGTGTQFRFTAEREVELIIWLAATASLSNGHVLFTLPADARPDRNRVVTTVQSNGVFGSGLVINTTGTVQLLGSLGTSGSGSTRYGETSFSVAAP